VVNDKANGLGRLFFGNDWIFEGVFLEDEVFENQKEGKLINGDKILEVDYIFIEDLKMKVFKTREGKIFSINRDNGYLKLIN
jgi:hypothetical protein